jgi:hypothetical protein
VKPPETKNLNLSFENRAIISHLLSHLNKLQFVKMIGEREREREKSEERIQKTIHRSVVDLDA